MTSKIYCRSIDGIFISTWPVKHFPHLTCATTPSYLQVAPWTSRRQSLPGPQAQPSWTTCRCQRPRNRRKTSWYVTSGRMGLILFTTCASWTQMPSPIQLILQRSAYRRRRERRSACTWRHAYISADTFPPMLPQLMDFWVWKQWLPWIGYPVSLQQSGGKPTHVRTDMPR